MKELTEDQKLHIACLVESKKTLDAVRFLRAYTEVVTDLIQARAIVQNIYKQILAL